MLMLNRGFFSLQSNWVPTLIALANLGLNAVLDAAFYSFGTWGIPFSTSLVNIAGSAALLVLLRRRLGRIELGETLDAFARIIVASALVAIVAFGVWWPLDHTLGRSIGAQLVSVNVALAASIAVYLLACRVLGVKELEALLTLRSRFRRP